MVRSGFVPRSIWYKTHTLPTKVCYAAYVRVHHLVSWPNQVEPVMEKMLALAGSQNMQTSTSAPTDMSTL